MYSLNSIQPDWESNPHLVEAIIKLEKLKIQVLDGSTPPHLSFELKGIFHKLESLGSGRIEGNQTTLSELIEQITEDAEKDSIDRKNEQLKEIFNIEKAMRHVEDSVEVNAPITKKLLFKLHTIITNDLRVPEDGGEGVSNPGNFRMKKVNINRSDLCPPDFAQVNDYIEELLDFVNGTVETRDQLLRVAIAHHRFAYIHPFENGNGRIVRLFTYALLLRYGFQVRDKEVEDGKYSERIGRILNPTAIFCVDREKYYQMLGRADSGKKEGVLAWCEYVLTGLLSEIEKIDKLLDYRYLKKHILIPAINDAREHRYLDTDEHIALSFVFKKGIEFLKASDLKDIFSTNDSVKISRMIKRLKERNILIPIEENGRIYTVSLTNKYLMRSVVGTLEQQGFTPGLEEG